MEKEVSLIFKTSLCDRRRPLVIGDRKETSGLDLQAIPIQWVESTENHMKYWLTPTVAQTNLSMPGCLLGSGVSRAQTPEMTQLPLCSYALPLRM